MKTILLCILFYFISCGIPKYNLSSTDLEGEFVGKTRFLNYTLQLYPKGRFYYSESLSYHYIEFTNGKWIRKNDTIILNSKSHNFEKDTLALSKHRKWIILEELKFKIRGKKLIPIKSDKPNLKRTN